MTNHSSIAAEDEIDMSWSSPNIPIAIGVSIGAGLATAIGGAMVFFPELLRRIPQHIILGVSLAISAGVMLYVSFVEIFANSHDAIAESGCVDTAVDRSGCHFGEGAATAVTTICFFCGMLCCVLLELGVHKIAGGSPGHDHSHGYGHGQEHTSPGGEAQAQTTTGTHGEAMKVDAVTLEMGKAGDHPLVHINEAEKARLKRMGLMTAIAIGVHNFPEGLATFLATMEDTSVGASLGVAIAVHNIPEGLCVAMPIYYATGNKWKAFLWSLLSGVSEPIGGIAGYAALQPVFTDTVFGVVFSMVGGMMVFIVCHELLPAAQRSMGDVNKTTAVLVLGMFIMATSLVIFAF